MFGFELQIVEFNLSKKRYTSFSRALDHKLPKQWSNRQFPVEGIVYDKQNSNVIIIYDDTTICFIDKTKVCEKIKFLFSASSSHLSKSHL